MAVVPFSEVAACVNAASAASLLITGCAKARFDSVHVGAIEYVTSIAEILNWVFVVFAFLNFNEVAAFTPEIVYVVDDNVAVASEPPSTLYFTVGVYVALEAVIFTCVIFAPLEGVKVKEHPSPFEE